MTRCGRPRDGLRWLAADAARRSGTVRLNIPLIADAVAEAVVRLPGRDPAHSDRNRRDEVRRMVCGYVYIDELLGAAVDPFAYGQSERLLEINHRVLCGVSPSTRAEAADHIADTRAFFYQVRPDGIGDLADWYVRHRNDSARAVAAGCYLRIVSTPQLFLEGNQRTAVLLVSWLLARRGFPPLVPTRETAMPLDRLSAEIKGIDRTTVAGGLRGYLLERQMRRFLVQNADWRFIAGADPKPLGSEI